MNQPTITEFKAWAKKNRHLAVAVCEAQAFAEMERARVDKYIAPVFASFTFEDKEGNPIKHQDDLYLCADNPDLFDFYEASRAAHRANGWRGREGHCPALTAEHALIEAQNAIIGEASTLMGVELNRLTSNKRKALLDTLLGACLKEEREAVAA